MWLPAVGYGVNVLWRYSTTPGHPASPPAQWPANAPIEREKGRATLIMFAHPQCGCSKASLGELAVILARTPGRLDAHVFFYQPPDQASSWAQSDLWEDAKAIPGVRVAQDRNNTIAQDFGVFTSGQTIVYDSNGQLLFNGGITASRGHSGDNYGRDAIVALLQNHPLASTSLPVTTQVFGCSLRNE